MEVRGEEKESASWPTSFQPCPLCGGSLTERKPGAWCRDCDGWFDPNQVMEKRAHIGTDNGTHHTVGLPHFSPPGPLSDELGYSVDDGSHEVGNRPKSLVGKTKGGRLVWFDPDMPEHRLSNEHLTVTGESGSGKTQSMKTIMADLHDQGIPALVLDFKDDYSEARYADREGFEVYDPTKAPLPLNPLVPPVDQETGMVNTTFHAYQLSDIVGRIYRLGDIQAYSLRQAILATYEDVGLPTGSFKPNVDQNWPQFQSVKVKLGEPRGKEKSPNGELIGRMSPIFDFGLFSSPDPKSFAAIASANTVIRLSQLPGNEVKNSVAEFFLMALYNHLVRQPQAHTLSSLLVLDEAWRVANSPFLEPLMREGRAFGLGVFVATQFPTDLPLTVSGNAASQLFFSQSDPDQVAEVERIMTGHRNTPEADRLGSTIRGLLPLQAVLHNKQYQPYATFDASPYFTREKRPPTLHGSPLPRAAEGENLNLSKHAQNWEPYQDKGTPLSRGKISPHEDDEFPGEYWFDRNGGPSQVADSDMFDPERRKYVEQVDGKYICQCGFSTDNEDHICDYCKAIGSLNGMSYGDDQAANRVEKYKDWWKQEPKTGWKGTFGRCLDTRD